jgi:hypothetical protein
MVYEGTSTLGLRVPETMPVIVNKAVPPCLRIVKGLSSNPSAHVLHNHGHAPSPEFVSRNFISPVLYLIIVSDAIWSMPDRDPSKIRCLSRMNRAFYAEHQWSTVASKPEDYDSFLTPSGSLMIKRIRIWALKGRLIYSCALR